MKLRDILKEEAAAGSVSAGAMAGFRGSLFGGGALISRLPSKKRVKKIKYTKKEKVKDEQ